MTVLIAIVRVWPTIIAKVLDRALCSILKTLGANLHPRPLIPPPIASRPTRQHRYAPIVSGSEAAPILFLHPVRHIGPAILVAVVWIGPAAIAYILHRSVHSILKSAQPYLAARPGPNAPAPTRSTHAWPTHSRSAHARPTTIRPAHRRLLALPRKVSNALLVATPKTILIGVPLIPRNVRPPVFLAIVHVRPPVIPNIFLRPDNPVPISLPLNIPHLRRWRIPPTAILPISL